MARFERPFLAVTVIAAILLNASGKEPTTEQREVASMIESHLSILEAIDSFDLHIEGSSMVTINDVPSHEIRSKVRWIRCSDHDRHLYLRVAELFPLIESNASSKPNAVRDTAVSVALQRDGVCITRSFPGPSVSTKSGASAFESLAAAPDFELIGLIEFPLIYSAQQGRHESLVKFFKQPHPGYSIAESSPTRVSLVHSLDKRKSGGGKYTRWWDFDPEKLVLTSVRHHQWREKEKSLVPFYTQTLEWATVGHMVVPKAIHGEKVQKVLINPSEKVIVDQHESHEYAFRWTTVNEPIDEQLFSRDVLTSMHTVKQMTDVEAYQDISRVD